MLSFSLVGHFPLVAGCRIRFMALLNELSNHVHIAMQHEHRHVQRYIPIPIIPGQPMAQIVTAKTDQSAASNKGQQR
jgi:hypothetical protein